MKIVFIGVVNIGWHFLKALLESRANVVGIFTADKQEMVKKSAMHPAYFSEFDDLSLEYGIPVYKIIDVSVSLDIRRLSQLQPDIIFCIGWPQIIPKEILNLPQHGCIGIHPTLLPDRRGGAPVNWCLIDGLNKSGVTLFYFNDGVDSGDIIAQREFEITIEDTAKTVLDKVSTIAVLLIKDYYPALEEGKAPRTSQDFSQATYTKRRRPEDGLICWGRSSLSIYNWIRALTLPFPGAFTYYNGNKMMILESELIKGYKPRFDAQPGEILDISDQRGLVIATGDGCILIKTIAIEQGCYYMPACEFVKRFRILPRAVFGGK